MIIAAYLKTQGVLRLQNEVHKVQVCERYSFSNLKPRVRRRRTTSACINTRINSFLKLSPISPIIFHAKTCQSCRYTGLIGSLAIWNGNDNDKNIIAYIVVFEPKYTLLHLISNVPLSKNSPRIQIKHLK